MGDTEAYGIREPQMVKLARRLHLPKASSDRKETVLEIKRQEFPFGPMWNRPGPTLQEK